ncbi:hypothetical protein BDP81DRAFT_422579 [Colletotrichum phormii]|uniref:Uncharacterized protein n=1 Tax=Colletotrichum phormii TaxID=359342 RepID=A0AAI9ZXN1_9PEZI|nr:uncharacterized protein BDP81DRAFT_422579 [Colletotrichum phormii]KAK1638744.1 hypothetical protein BDP81DRAFT_422579 [Colletotrichum phormii]
MHQKAATRHARDRTLVDPNNQGKCELNAPPCMTPMANPSGILAPIRENTRFFRRPGL